MSTRQCRDLFGGKISADLPCVVQLSYVPIPLLIYETVFMMCRSLSRTSNLADLPPGVIDVSYVLGCFVLSHLTRETMNRDIRQVPDSQEVFVYTDSDSFLSVEVLQRVPKDDDTEAVK